MPPIILLVEDDPDILDIMFFMLNDAGYQVLKSTGGDALLQARTQPPDLVILDHRLQVAWGADICRALKADLLTSAIPVIMMSATMHLEDTARSAGADGVLTKPFDMQTLLDVVAAKLAKCSPSP